MTYQDPDKKEKEDNASAEDAPEASAPAYPLGKPSEGKPSKEEKPEKTNNGTPASGGYVPIDMWNMHNLIIYNLSVSFQLCNFNAHLDMHVGH